MEMKLTLLAMAGLALAMAMPAMAVSLNDVPKYIADARKAIEKDNKSDARTNLDLAEAELDDVKDAAMKAEYAAQIKSLRDTIDGAANAAETERLVKQVEAQMTDLKGAIGDKIRFDDYAKDLFEMIDRPATRKAIGDEKYAQVKKQVATFRKVSDKQHGEKMLERAERDLESLEKELPELLEPFKEDRPAAQNNAARSFGYKTDSLNKIFDVLPEENDKAKTLAERYEAVQKKFNAVYGAAMAKEKVERLSSSWQSYEYEWNGWEEEQGGPTFVEITKEQSQKMTRVGAPKTAAMILRANWWLNNLVDDEMYQMYKDDAGIVKVVGEMTARRQKGWDKIAANAEKILKGAEAATLNKDTRDRLESFANDDLRLSMEAHPKIAEFHARAMKLVDAFDAKTVGKQKAAEALEQKLRSEADGAWSNISQKFKVADSFEIESWKSYKGKTIRLSEVGNRMGWDFKPGEYDFAVKIDGQVVAGRFDPAIKKVVADVLERTMKKELPEEPYELFAVVEKAGVITEIVRSEAEGEVRSGGDSAQVKARVREEIPTDCVIVKIVALKVGPIATSVR